MRDIINVFSFTLRDNIRKKTFIVTTLIVLILIFAGCALPSLLGKGDSSDNIGVGDMPNTDIEDTKKANTCYVIDQDNLIPSVVEALTTAFPNIQFSKGEPGKLDEYKETIETDSSIAVMEIYNCNLMPALRFTVTDFFSGVPTDAIAEVVHQSVVSGVLSNAGVDQDTAKLVLSDIEYVTIPVGKMDVTGYALGIVLTIIIFFAVYFYGYGVAMSVASEKTSRVMETLIVSTKPSHILIGKCIAMGVLGLIQLTIFILAAALGYKLLIPDDFTISGVPLALSSFTVSSALLILVYFLLGYSLYAMINSVCGATVSRSEDLQSAMMPVVLISLISFYASYIAMFLPDQGIKRILTYIPFTSPFIMPFRLLNENIASVDIIISVLLLIVATVLVSLISIKLYSASVLHYGQRLKLKDLFRLRR
jgi:ABC-2 type transport system permease protein